MKKSALFKHADTELSQSWLECLAPTSEFRPTCRT